MNLDKLRNTLRTTLIDIWEYVIPIWKISGLFKRIKSKKDLENFIQERSAHVSQTTLYGYLKTRIGVKYIAMMEDEVFLKSINIAKWNIYVVALADCAFYAAILFKDPDPMSVTVNCSMNFFKRPSVSDLFAKATILKFGQKLVVGEVTIYSGTVKNSVAQAMMTYARPIKK